MIDLAMREFATNCDSNNVAIRLTTCLCSIVYESVVAQICQGQRQNYWGLVRMGDWLVATLRTYPELAIFIALAVGFWIGPKKIAGFNLGNVTATLLAAVAIGQLGIEIPGPINEVVPPVWTVWRRS